MKDAGLSHLGRALALARRARPSPNPRVGAVVVKAGRVVGEGFHARAGGDHAEIVAIREAGVRARGSTLYVTLEPCAHVGRTPPCIREIVRSGIARVVVGCLDPNPLVNGRGVAQLRSASVRVDLDATRAAEACRRLIEEWSTYITTGLPFVRLKAALSLDGRMACASGDSKWISGEAARRETHRMRDRADAVLVGLGTIRRDDPMLTVRSVKPSGPPPVRVVLDPALETSERAAVIRSTDRYPTIVAHTRGKVARLRRAGGDRLYFLRCRSDHGLVDLRDLLEKLAARGVTSVLVEGGGTVHTSFLEKDLADAVSLFVAPVLIGGRDAVPFFGGTGAADMSRARRLVDIEVRHMGADVLFEGRLR